MTKKSNQKPLTKSAFVKEIADKLGVTKTSVEQVLATVTDLVTDQLGPKGPGAVVIPGLLRLKAVQKPATPERQGINPFTKQPTTFAAKPASTKVKASPVKTLKESIQK